MKYFLQNDIIDNGMKKSLKGYIAVYKDENGKYFTKDQVSLDDVFSCQYHRVWADGKFHREYDLKLIRDRVALEVGKGK